MTAPPDVKQAIGYARRALNHAKDAWVDIKIDYMSLNDALYWDATMQRDIVLDGVRARRAGAPQPRADLFWSWAGIRLLLPLSQRLSSVGVRA